MRYARHPMSVCYSAFAVRCSGQTRFPIAQCFHSSTQESFVRLSQTWTPTGGIELSRDDDSTSHALLVRAGFLRKTQPGVFHLLPLGFRVQQKLERLIARHMRSIGASEVALSSLSTAQLWRSTGRLGQREDDFFLLQDRNKTDLLLAPTHEEEITSLVSSVVRSHKDLPLRLFQITRKYRDERRPRQGLLRGREFVMKDLYTFDATVEQAKETYEKVQQAYRRFFDDLRVPYLVAKADSGNMGGDLSHEYHFVCSAGEDTVLSCDSCSYTANEEVAILGYEDTEAHGDQPALERAEWYGTNKERTILVHAVFPAYSPSFGSPPVANQANVAAVKAALPGVDIHTAVHEPAVFRSRNPDVKQLSVVDPRLGSDDAHVSRVEDREILLTRPTTGTPCPSCKKGGLQVHTAIEIGHTFHLGTRYSTPLKAQVTSASQQTVDVQMGCHGIGVSRLVGALATVLSDCKGLNWPAVVAPFSIVVLYSEVHRDVVVGCCNALQQDLATVGEQLADKVDIALDDRNKSIGWKLHDADQIGYPIVIVFGKRFGGDGLVEVQCRQLEIREHVPLDSLKDKVAEVLKQL